MNGHPGGRVKSCSECRQQKLRCDSFKDYSRPCSRCSRLGIECVFSKTFKRRPKQSKAELLREIERLKKQTVVYEDKISLVNQGSPQEYRSPSSISNGGLTCSNNSMQSHLSSKPTCEDMVTNLDYSVHNNRIQNEVPSPMILPPAYSSHSQPSPGNSIVENTVPFAAPNQAISLMNPLNSPNSTQIAADELLTAKLPSSLPKHAFNYSQVFMGSSSSQPLEDLHVDSNRIADCYNLFFLHYAPSLPGLFNADIPANEVFSQSPLLFWTIVCVGARRYQRDPTIFDRLSKRIVGLVLSSLCFNPKVVPVIQAIILLCLWRPPISTVFKDPSQALAGSAMQLAIQNGLHMIGRETDFSWKPGQKKSIFDPETVRGSSSGNIEEPETVDEEMKFRARLWIYCLIVFQSTSFCDGLPPTSAPEFSSVPKTYFTHLILPPKLSYRYKLHRIKVDALSEIRRKIDLEGHEPSDLLSSIIEIYDRIILETAPPNLDAIELHERNCARLLIRSFHFFEKADSSRQQKLLDLFFIASEVIELTELLDRSQQENYANQHETRMLMLAAYTVVRIAKSPLNDYLPAGKPEKLVFSAINFSKRRTVQDNDLDARNAAILTKLWVSETAFIRSDGIKDSLRLELRNRMAMSVVFDCFHWWRKEFGTVPDNKDSAYESEIVKEKAREELARYQSNPQVLNADNLNRGNGDLLDYTDQNISSDFFEDWDWVSSITGFDFHQSQISNMKA